MSNSTSVRYAIRLPNGILAHDLPGDVKSGSPQYETLPVDRRAWVWGEHDRHHAYRTLHAIADTVKHWGLHDLFKDRAAVVMVRTTVEILDGDHDPEQDDYHNLPDGQEKELRSLISILEEGEERHPGGARIPVLIEQLKRIADSGRAPETDGSENAEPRTWRFLDDIPTGVHFRAAGSDASPTWYRGEDGQLYQVGGGGELSATLASSVARIWGSSHGFTEVVTKAVKAAE